MLCHRGYVVETVANGPQTLEKIKRERKTIWPLQGRRLSVSTLYRWITPLDYSVGLLVLS